MPAAKGSARTPLGPKCALESDYFPRYIWKNHTSQSKCPLTFGLQFVSPGTIWLSPMLFWSVLVIWAVIGSAPMYVVT